MRKPHTTPPPSISTNSSTNTPAPLSTFVANMTRINTTRQICQGTTVVSQHYFLESQEYMKNREKQSVSIDTFSHDVPQVSWIRHDYIMDVGPEGFNTIGSDSRALCIVKDAHRYIPRKTCHPKVLIHLEKTTIFTRSRMKSRACAHFPLRSAAGRNQEN